MLNANTMLAGETWQQELDTLTYSYDMLGEAARTRADAKRYFDAYADAIRSVGTTSKALSAKTPPPSISIKLSALHPRYEFGRRDQVIDAINGRGYGLTFRVHSRNQSFANEIARKIRAGNVYINRDIIGAVVGVQPFGGQGLSGTGPRAGGPHYLLRFATEKTVTENTAALGGATHRC